MTSVAVHTLVIDPTWNTESGVAATPVALLSTPAAASTTSSPAATATAAPGTLLSASSSDRRCGNHSLISSSLDMAQRLGRGGRRAVRPRRRGYGVDSIGRDDERRRGPLQTHQV